MNAFMTPLRSFQSIGLRPAAATFTLISPGPGLGSAMSCGASLLLSPYSLRTIALMAPSGLNYMNRTIASATAAGDSRCGKCPTPSSTTRW